MSGTIYCLSSYSHVPGGRIRKLTFVVHLLCSLVSIFVLYTEYSFSRKGVDWKGCRTALVTKGLELSDLSLSLSISYISFVLSCYTQPFSTWWSIFTSFSRSVLLKFYGLIDKETFIPAVTVLTLGQMPNPGNLPGR